MSLSVETSLLAHTNVLLTSLSSITSSSHSHTMPPKPLPEHTVKTCSSNTKKHPGEADYSADEDSILHLPKTPKTRKGCKPKVIKDAVSAEDTGANIKCLATYERQSLDNDINDVTPYPVFTPAPSIRQYIMPINHSDPLISSNPNNMLEEEKSGLMTDNQPYIPLAGSNSETDTLTDEDDDSIHPPMAKVVAGRLKGVHDAGVKEVGQRGNTTKSNGGPAHLLPAKAIHKTIKPASHGAKTAAASANNTKAAGDGKRAGAINQVVPVEEDGVKGKKGKRAADGMKLKSKVIVEPKPKVTIQGQVKEAMKVVSSISKEGEKSRMGDAHKDSIDMDASKPKPPTNTKAMRAKAMMENIFNFGTNNNANDNADDADNDDKDLDLFGQETGAMDIDRDPEVKAAGSKKWQIEKVDVVKKGSSSSKGKGVDKATKVHEVFYCHRTSLMGPINVGTV